MAAQAARPVPEERPVEAAPWAGDAARPAPGRREGREPIPPRRRWQEATIVIPGTAESILRFEAFVEGLGFLDRPERDRLKLAGGEIFDNLVHHAGVLEGGRVLVRAARRDSGPLLAFYFKAEGFAAYASRCRDRGGGLHEPRFDRATRRWHGIGSLMCRNLSRSITFRAGSLIDRIFIAF